MDILSISERLAAIDRSAIVYDPQVCVHTRDRKATCQACFTTCPTDAIQPGTPPTLNADACQSCLACLPACPVDAFHADDAVADLLICATRLEVKTIEVVCELHPDPERGASRAPQAVRVKGCLAGLGAGAYLTLAALGMETIYARAEMCGECPWGKAQSQITAQVQAASDLLRGWDRQESIQAVLSPPAEAGARRPLWRAENPPISRRDLFRLAAQRSQVAAARMMAADQDKRAGPQPGRDRRRANQALGQMPQAGENASSVKLGEYGYARVTVSEKCSACGVCARACPTAALTLTSSESSGFELALSPQNCIGCDICARVCAPQAVAIDHQPDFAYVFQGDQPIVLLQGSLTRCDRCNILFAATAGAELCPPCEFRRSHPFGVRIPPGFEALQRLVDRLGEE